MSARDTLPLDSVMELAGSIAAIPVEHARIYGAHQCDWMSAENGMPEPFRTVIAWASAIEMPIVAYFDDEEKCWYSQHDGAHIKDVTDWMHYRTPNGVDSSSSRPACTSAGVTRATRIRRLAEQANSITAMLSKIHVLEGADQESVLLDCSSMADDFARDLDTLVGEPA